MPKSLTKFLIAAYLFAFILFISGTINILNTPSAQAADVKFTPQVEIPGFSSEFSGSKEGYTIPASTEGIAKFVRVIYKYAIGIIGILASVMLMFGGVLWITAAGNQTRVGEAKSWIVASLTGLVIALCSYLILATINPALVNFTVTKVGTVEQAKIPLTTQEMDAKCFSECGNISGPYQYDPKTNTCICYGSGKHTECQVETDASGNRADKCVEVPYAGTNTCTNDNSCTQKYGCCQCNYIAYTSCTAQTSFTSLKSCDDWCNFFGLVTRYFTPSALCDKNKNCVAQ